MATIDNTTRITVSYGGVPGPAGITWRGNWSAATQYQFRDAVYYNGQSWFALLANINVTPGSDPLKWNELAGYTESNVVHITGVETITGLKTFSPTANNAVGIIVKGLAGQTGDLQQWQNNAAAVLARVTSTGAAEFAGLTVAGTPFDPTGIAYLDVAQTFTAAQLITAPSAAVIPLSVRGAASQTANLQEWQNSAGTVLSRVFATGAFGIGTTLSFSASLNVQPLSASGVGQVIRGQAAQTGVLQEWQDSASNTLVRIANTGSLLVIPATGTGYALRVHAAAAGDTATQIRGVVGQTADLLQFQNDAAAVLARVSATGHFGIGALTNSAFMLKIQSDGAGVIPIVAQGFAGQTGDLQNWQDSAGTNLMWVTSDGRLVHHASISGSTRIGVRIPDASPSHIGLIIRGAVGQTGNLQEWQNSAGVSLASVSAAGTLTATDVYAGSGSNNLGWSASTTYFARDGGAGEINMVLQAVSGARLRVTAGHASAVPFAVRGAASQTGDLQHWQNSSGTPLVGVSAAGNILLYASGTTSRYIISDQGATYAGVHVMQAGFGSAGAGGALNLFGHAHATKPGWVTAGISSGSSGKFTVNDSALGAGNDLLLVQGGTTNPKLVVKAVASQTASLQEWQNSAGTVLASVRSNGSVRAEAGTGTGFEWYSGATLIGQAFIDANQYAGTVSAVRFLSTSANTRPFVFESGHPSAPAIVTRAAAAHVGTIQEWQNNAQEVLLSVEDDGVVRLNNDAALVSWLNAASGNVFNSLTARATTDLPLRIRQFSSAQTANLTEWTSASGSTLYTYVSPGGRVVVSAPLAGEFSGLSVSGAASGGTVGATINSGAAANIGMYVRGFSAQTANLQEWQNSAGTILARVSSAGVLASGVDASIGNLTPLTNTSFSVFTRSVGDAGIRVRGFAGQTANLQEWQDSAGTLLSYVDADGTISNRAAINAQAFRVEKSVTNNNYQFLIDKDASDNARVHFRHDGSAVDFCLDYTGRVGIGASVPTAQLHVITAAATVAMITRAAAAQTADLHQYTNSTPTTLHRVNKDGYQITAKVTAPADADINASEAAYWLDPTPGATKFMIKAKDSGGTVRTAAVPLA